MKKDDKFVITQETIGERIEIAINDVKFCSLYNAKETLSAAFSLEEKYQLLLMNFLELEKEVLNSSLEYRLFNHTEYSEFFDIRLKINQRVVNFLTSCRLYVDHAKSHIKRCLPPDIYVKDRVECLFNDEFDQYFEYRFCEKLRNHVQHQSLAVHIVSHGLIWVGDQRVETTKLYAKKSQLEDSKSFTKRYLNELPEKIELITVFKKYIELISKIQSKIRLLIKDSIVHSRHIIEECISTYTTENKGENAGLAAIHFKNNEQGEFYKHCSFPLFLDWDDLRIKLENKNVELVGFSHQKIETAYEKPVVLQTQLRQIAEAVRKVIENVPLKERVVGLQHFPNGSCGDASAILGQYLADSLNIDFDYCCGFLDEGANRVSHAWLQNDDFIIDITADQFADIDIKIWVTLKSKWHVKWFGKKQSKATFEFYDKGALMPLEPFYQKIKPLIDAEMS